MVSCYDLLPSLAKFDYANRGLEAVQRREADLGLARSWGTPRSTSLAAPIRKRRRKEVKMQEMGQGIRAAGSAERRVMCGGGRGQVLTGVPVPTKERQTAYTWLFQKRRQLLFILPEMNILWVYLFLFSFFPNQQSKSFKAHSVPNPTHCQTNGVSQC